MSVATPHCSLLQPADLPASKLQDAPEGARQEKNLCVAGPGTPMNVPGTVDGAGHARVLPELAPGAVTPQQLGARRDRIVGLINQLIHAIGSDRGRNGGTLSPEGEVLRECVNRCCDAFSLLDEGSTAGDRLMAQMEDLEKVATFLKSEIDGASGQLPEDLRMQVRVLREDLLAQVQDRIAYLGHTVANAPLSLHRMYESKARFSEGAVRVINAQLLRCDLSSAQRSQLEEARDHIFAARAAQLRQEAREQFGKPGNAREVLGEKPKFLSLLGIGAQHRAREALGRELMACAAGAPLPCCNTPRIDEQTIIQDTLEKVFEEARLVDLDLGHAFHDAMEWKPILN